MSNETACSGRFETREWIVDYASFDSKMSDDSLFVLVDECNNALDRLAEIRKDIIEQRSRSLRELRERGFS